MLDVIIVSDNDGIFWLIFHGELIWRVRLVLRGEEVGEIDQFSRGCTGENAQKQICSDSHETWRSCWNSID